ncbi:MAG TPA: 23S rRNA (pseudouridine(1915)-N(3))-methyltransferase RlmH [Thermoleophilia bacterium]|nr:23S rRNA (pseudouridine(1915)-N(3))-methyltransferase RlmH [Thermoleophilia bacterium]
MRVTLVCVGRLSRDYQPVFAHYRSLIRPYGTLDVEEVPETPISHGEAHVLKAEGDALLKRLRPHVYTVVLDRSGRRLTSEGLSRLLAEQKLYGRSDFQFILGGALGLDERVREAADLVWSLSELTFPHQLARCIVLEQIYRATRIERGEPYHH